MTPVGRPLGCAVPQPRHAVAQRPVAPLPATGCALTGRRDPLATRLLSPLSSSCSFLRTVAAASAAAALAALAAATALAPAAGRALRVGDRSCARLAHPLLAQAFVLLVVLDARPVILRHQSPPGTPVLKPLYPRCR